MLEGHETRQRSTVDEEQTAEWQAMPDIYRLPPPPAPAGEPTVEGDTAMRAPPVASREQSYGTSKQGTITAPKPG